MSVPSQPFSAVPKTQSLKPQIPVRPDFEHNLVEFQLEFFEFVNEADPNFDLDLLRNNPNPPIEVPEFENTGDQMHPATKAELSMLFRLTGPKVVNGDIFGDKISLESEIRVRGSVYGRTEVKIGPSCVIEGGVISGGSLEIGKGSRIEGAVVGGEVRLEGPIHVEGPIYSRGTLASRGRLEAQTLYAATKMSLLGEKEMDAVRLETGLMMVKNGDIEVDVPVWLAQVEAKPDLQKFYLGRDEAGELKLQRAATTSPTAIQGLSTIFTTLTDAELEKMVAELAKLEA